MVRADAAYVALNDNVYDALRKESSKQMLATEFGNFCTLINNTNSNVDGARSENYEGTGMNPITCRVANAQYGETSQVESSRVESPL